MTKITVYDDVANALEAKADEMDTTIAEVVDALMDFINELE